MALQESNYRVDEVGQQDREGEHYEDYPSDINCGKHNRKQECCQQNVEGAAIWESHVNRLSVRGGANRMRGCRPLTARNSRPHFERCRAFSSGSKELSGSDPSALRRHWTRKVSIGFLSASLKYACARLPRVSASGLRCSGTQCAYLNRDLRSAGR